MYQDDEVEFDPRLDRAQAVGDADDLIDVVVRLAKAGVYPDGLLVAADLGPIVTGQVLVRDIERVHDSDQV